MNHDQAPLQALLLPFETGVLAKPQGGALFLRARDGWPLRGAAIPGLVVEQGYKPESDALVRAGHALADANDAGTFPTVLLLPPRQREELRALFAQALDRCQEGGLVI